MPLSRRLHQNAFRRPQPPVAAPVPSRQSQSATGISYMAEHIAAEAQLFLAEHRAAADSE